MKGKVGPAFSVGKNQKFACCAQRQFLIDISCFCATYGNTLKNLEVIKIVIFKQHTALTCPTSKNLEEDFTKSSLSLPCLGNNFPKWTLGRWMTLH